MPLGLVVVHLPTDRSLQSQFTLKLLLLLVVLVVVVCVGGGACSCADVEIRGQLYGVDSPLQIIRLMQPSTFTYWASSKAPTLKFLIFYSQLPFFWATDTYYHVWLKKRIFWGLVKADFKISNSLEKTNYWTLQKEKMGGGWHETRHRGQDMENPEDIKPVLQRERIGPLTTVSILEHKKRNIKYHFPSFCDKHCLSLLVLPN